MDELKLGVLALVGRDVLSREGGGGRVVGGGSAEERAGTADGAHQRELIGAAASGLVGVIAVVPDALRLAEAVEGGENARAGALLLAGHEGGVVGGLRQRRGELLREGVEVDVAHGEVIARGAAQSHVGLLARLVVLRSHEEEGVAVLREERHVVVAADGVVVLAKRPVGVGRTVEVERQFHQPHVESGAAGIEQLEVDGLSAHHARHILQIEFGHETDDLPRLAGREGDEHLVRLLAVDREGVGNSGVLLQTHIAQLDADGIAGSLVQREAELRLLSGLVRSARDGEDVGGGGVLAAVGALSCRDADLGRGLSAVGKQGHRCLAEQRQEQQPPAELSVHSSRSGGR